MAIKKYPRSRDGWKLPPKPSAKKRRQYAFDSTGATWDVYQQVRREVDAIPVNLWKPWTVHQLPCGIPIMALGDCLDPPALHTAAVAKEKHWSMDV